MRMKLVGLKHQKGISSKNGKAYDFWNALLVSDFQKQSKELGSVGNDVHVVGVSDRFADIFTAANIGAEFEVETYFARGFEIVGYAALADSKK